MVSRVASRRRPALGGSSPVSLADFQRRALAVDALHMAQQNKAGQTRLLSEARRHADTAMLIATSDPIVAADAAHQAARKAILAVIDSHGYRIAHTTRGHHLAVIEYAEHSGVFDAASTKQTARPAPGTHRRRLRRPSRHPSTHSGHRTEPRCVRIAHRQPLQQRARHRHHHRCHHDHR